MTTTKLDVKLFIQTCSVEEISELYDSLKARRGILDNAAHFKFSPGDQIKFDAGRRGIIHGTIESFGRGGRVNVKSTNGMRWKVAGSLLVKTGDPNPPPPPVVTEDEF